MRGLGWFVTITKMVLLAVAVAAPLLPLPSIPSVPDGTDVKVVSATTAVYATGVVKNRVLSISTTSGKLPSNEKVQLWIGIPTPGDSSNRDLKSLPAVTSATGTDIIILVEGRERVSFTQLLKDAYGVRLELR
jgi:hypothetical protein